MRPSDSRGDDEITVAPLFLFVRFNPTTSFLDKSDFGSKGALWVYVGQPDLLNMFGS